MPVSITAAGWAAFWVLTSSYRKTERDQLVFVSKGVALKHVGATTAECRDVGVDFGDWTLEEATARARGVAVLPSKQAAGEICLSEPPNRLCWNDRLRCHLEQRELASGRERGINCEMPPTSSSSSSSTSRSSNRLRKDHLAPSGRTPEREQSQKSFWTSLVSNCNRHPCI